MQDTVIVRSLGFYADVDDCAFARLIYLIDATIAYTLNEIPTHDPRLPTSRPPGRPGIVQEITVCDLTPTAISFVVGFMDSVGNYSPVPITYHGSYLVEWVD